MPTFTGMNTVGQYKRFTLTDQALIKRDLLNALSIRQGEKPGRPAYGTILWDLLFDNQSAETTQSITNEVKRVVSSDPRIKLLDCVLYTYNNGVIVEVQIAYASNASPESLAIQFDTNSGTATYV